MKGKHAQKNFGAVGAMAPTPLSLKTRGGRGGRGLGGVAYKDRARPPSRGCITAPMGGVSPLQYRTAVCSCIIDNITLWSQSNEWNMAGVEVFVKRLRRRSCNS